MSKPKTTAGTIIAILGGTYFIGQARARNIFTIGNGVTFMLPPKRAANGATYVRITLDANGTYRTQFQYWDAFNNRYRLISEYFHIAPEQLKLFFTKQTGIEI